MVEAMEPGTVDFHQNKTEVSLLVNKAALSDVLNLISLKSDILIHDAGLSDRIVSASCIGPSIKVVLDCLLGGSIDMVFRYRKNADDFPYRQASELWLLGSTLGQSAYSEQCAESEVISNKPDQDVKTTVQVGQVTSSQDEHRAFRMQMAASDNALQRSQAISHLAVHAAIEDVAVNRLIEAALMDSEPEVRAQAISALVRRQGEQNSITELEQAMQDVDVSVRISALQQLNDTTDLIDQALTDENEAVRQLAMMKLQAKQ